MSESPQNPSSPSLPPSAEGAAAQIPTARPITLPYAITPAVHNPPWPAAILRLSAREASLDLFLILFVGLIVHYLPQLIVVAFLGMPDIPDSPLLMIASKYGELLLALTILIYLVRRHRLPASAFGWRRSDPLLQGMWALAALAGAYCALLLTAPLMIALYLLYPEVGQDLEQRYEFAKLFGTRNLMIDVTLMAAVGFHEEILFRGLMLPYLRRLTGSWTAAILAVSAIFGVLHVPSQGILAGFQIMLLGVSFGLFFVLSRSILSVALAHMAFNLIQLQVLEFVVDMMDQPATQAAGG